MLQEIDSGLQPPTPDFRHFIALSQIGVRTPFEYAGERVEEAQAKVGLIVRGLAEHGKYQTLGSSEFQTELTEFLDNFPEGSMRDDVRYASVGWFVGAVTANIRNCTSDEVHLNLSHAEKQRATGQIFQIFAQMGEAQAIMEHYPNITKVRQMLAEISHTPLVWDENGLLFNREQYDSNEQRGRMVLLSITGLRRSMAESVVDLVRYAPCVSRKVTGMLPTAMMRFAEYLHPEDRQSPDYPDFCAWVQWAATHSWPTPPSSDPGELAPWMQARLHSLQELYTVGE